MDNMVKSFQEFLSKVDEKNTNNYADNKFRASEEVAGYEPALVLIMDSDVKGDEHWVDKVAWINSVAKSCECEVLGIVENSIIVHGKHQDGGVATSDLAKFKKKFFTD